MSQVGQKILFLSVSIEDIQPTATERPPANAQCTITVTFMPQQEATNLRAIAPKANMLSLKSITHTNEHFYRAAKPKPYHDSYSG